MALAALVIAFAMPVHAGLDAGSAAYARGDYAAALAQLRPLAEQGDARARMNLAIMYLTGRGVTRDGAAFNWHVYELERRGQRPTGEQREPAVRCTAKFK